MGPDWGIKIFERDVSLEVSAHMIHRKHIKCIGVVREDKTGKEPVRSCKLPRASPL